MTQVTVVVGGQFGSEGKGAVAGFLGRKMRTSDLAIRVAGPNAGHTVYSDLPGGQAWKLRSVPVAAVTSPNCQLHIAAGSEIDLEVLDSEMSTLDAAGYRASSRLTIHPSATVIGPHHVAREKESGIVGRIGSTGKGVGAARADRIARDCQVAADIPYLARFLSEPGPLDLSDVDQIVIEGTQGYGLGLHTAYYPQTTSSDCRAIDFLAMAGISPWAMDGVGDPIQVRTIVVARTFPIRVAGNSGPLKDETTWAELNLPEERTTVTNKVRRVGAWDSFLLGEAIRANGGGCWNPQVTLAITMLDHMFPETAGLSDFDKAPEDAVDWLLNIQDLLETDIAYVGTGPRDLIEVAI